MGGQLSQISGYLLEAGLDVLHEQSREWLSELAFWREEASFFNNFVIKKTRTSVPLEAKESLQKIEAELSALAGVKLDGLQKKVMDHENFLGLLLENDFTGEESYRLKHRTLLLEIQAVEHQFTCLKKDVFELDKMLLNLIKKEGK